MKILLIALIQSIIITIGQVMLKFGLQKFDTFSWSWNFWRTVVLNIPFVVSGIMMVTGTVMWMWMVKSFPLSQLLPLQAVGYVLGILASMFFFHETVNWSQWAGMVLIMLGCVLIGK